MELIQTVTVGSGGASSIEFTSIPQDGTDLLLLLSGRVNDVSENNAGRIWFSADETAANYSEIWLRGRPGAGTPIISAAYSVPFLGYFPGTETTSNTFGNGTITIPNYTSSVAKSFSTEIVTENNGTDAILLLVAGQWSGTSAITSVKLVNASVFVQHTTASLYKITKGSDGIVTTS